MVDPGTGGGEGGNGMTDGPGRRYSSQGGAAMGMSLAFEFAGAVALFLFLGWLVDRWLGIDPWGQVTGGVIGWFGGVAHVYYSSQNRAAATRTAEKRRRTS